jgi:hypothetical protein
MDISVHKLFKYDHVHQLLFVGDNYLCFCKDNAPMNQQPIKAHKGIDNRLIFRVLDPDRNPVNMCGFEIYGRLTDPNNNTIVFEKLAKQGTATGMIFWELDAGDLIDIPAGPYDFVLLATQPFVVGQNAIGSYIEQPLFVNFNDDVRMTLLITEQALKEPVPSVIIHEDEWTGDSFFPTGAPPSFGFYSKAIAGARVLNHKSSVHTFSTYTQNFTGVLEIFATLDETPSPYLDSTRWFKIYPSSMAQDIEYMGYSGTQAWTFQANFMWLKFRYFPSTSIADPGRMVKIIVRA